MSAPRSLRAERVLDALLVMPHRVRIRAARSRRRASTPASRSSARSKPTIAVSSSRNAALAIARLEHRLARAGGEARCRPDRHRRCAWSSSTDLLRDRPSTAGAPWAASARRRRSLVDQRARAGRARVAGAARASARCCTLARIVGWRSTLLRRSRPRRLGTHRLRDTAGRRRAIASSASSSAHASPACVGCRSRRVASAAGRRHRAARRRHAAHRT